MLACVIERKRLFGDEAADQSMFDPKGDPWQVAGVNRGV
jgi:hypothetical protein